ncbi:signal peptidase II [Enterobacteriaceae endosymbiont of Donacia sparganii]|uniref:signal peptidase II n=1 Tax=Enterobacteriaceae endosymbiont of Donacia sparganii TaxID=2675785 RepID=UPI0014575F1E
MVKNVYLFKSFFNKIKKKIKLSNICILIILILLDSFSKNFVIKNIKLYKYYYINNYLNFIYLQNYGIILGFLKNYKSIIYFLSKINIFFF